MDHLDNLCVQNFVRNLTVKGFWKSVYSTFVEILIKRRLYCFLRHIV